MEKQLKDLKQHLQIINDINAASALLSWDQATYMPPKGAAARGRQMATLSKLAHEHFTSAEVGHLLESLDTYADSLPPESDDRALIRVTIKDFEKAVKIPSELLATFQNHAAESYQIWTEARPENDFAKMRPYLAKTIELSRQLASYFPYDHIADPLIDMSDEGMKAETVRELFAELRAELVPLVQKIADKPLADDSCLQNSYPENQQLDFGTGIIKAYGYDFSRGRQDKTHHPFMTSFSVNDVRITTRVKENRLDEALFSTLHEAGHALYEQGVKLAYEATPLASGTSSGVHESQSRLWENIVGRSRGFWSHYYPQLQDAFPKQLENISLDTFYKAINKVNPSLIRTDADEVTYNLHVMIRFDLELALLEGELDVNELPEAWHARYESDLGVRAPRDVNGVLQDVHWFAGTVGGAFQGYTLGNIMSALFYQQAVQAHAEIPDEIGQGQFDTLLGWLRGNIYQHGRKYTANELIERITGGPLTIQPYVNYLTQKYTDLYDL